MSERRAKAQRKTLWSHGRKGEADWMRVLVDAKEDRVEVHYKDGRARRRKEIFGNDRKGRADAIAWAEAYRDERKRLGAARADTTHLELWKAYTESPAWHDLRDKTKINYTERWNRWTRFRGNGTRVDDTTLHHIDRFLTAAREQKYAINQIRQVLNVARVVFNWGQTRKLVAENVFGGWRWKTPKDAVVLEPEEYTEEEFGQILAQLSPQDSRRWRAWVCLMIAGHHGGRANAVLNMVAEPVVDGDLVWPAGFQKNGKELVQPLTWDLVAALETARYWRRKLGYRGQWLIAGGTYKTRGETRELDEWMKDPAHKRVGTGAGTPRVVADKPFSYSGLYSMLIKAEQRAGVTHKNRRAFHGVRKMNAGNIADKTGDARLAMEWIGDDIRQAPNYLKRRADRLDRAAEAAGTTTTAPTTSREDA
jgi:hypothetical protein